LSAANAQARRRFLQFLAGSPLLAASGGLFSAWPGPLAARPELAIPDRASRALDVFQLKAVARGQLNPKAWHFIVNGADDGLTVEANRLAYRDWQIRARRLVDVSRVDTSLELLGERLDNPILLAPVGDQGSIHSEGVGSIGEAAGAIKATRGESLPIGVGTDEAVTRVAEKDGPNRTSATPAE